MSSSEIVNFIRESDESRGALKHYQRRYRRARRIMWFGDAMKYVGYFLAAAIYTGGLVAYQLNASERTGFPVLTVSLFICAGLVGLTFYAMGVRICAQCQVLDALLDSAVYACPFLSDRQRARAVSLKKSGGVQTIRAA